VTAAFDFDHRIDFLAEDSTEILRRIPSAPGIFALRGHDPAAEPYLSRAADIRRRLRRLLAPPEARNQDGTPVLSKRLNLRDRVASIEFTRTGSEFESLLTLYRATRHIFGAEQARKRLRLHTPYFLRITTQHQHPRVFATNRLSKKSFAESFGPFPSRAAAERYADAVLDLFKLRRCHEDLEPFPEHPGCAYGEMNKCLAPCKQSCTAEQYAAEAHSVFAFFATRGESILHDLAVQRDSASEALDFERASSLHAQYEKIRSAANLADPLIRPLADLRALIVQPSAPKESSEPESPAPTTPSSLAEPEPPTPTTPSSRPESALFADAAERPLYLSSSPGHQPPAPATLPTTEAAALFLLDAGRLCGPALLSTLGVRAVREQTAVGSSLFAQPLMLSAIPLAEPSSGSVISIDPPPTPVISTGAQRSGETPVFVPAQPPAPPPTETTTHAPEDRARHVLTQLEQQTHTLPEPDIAERCDYLSLFRRWYFRPEKQRQGEVFLPTGSPQTADGAWPLRRILNASARVVLGPPALASPVDREKAREATRNLKTRILHEGREGVEREVPILPQRPRKRKPISATGPSNEEQG
jgi:excinuclease ABC subunit C